VEGRGTGTIEAGVITIQKMLIDIIKGQLTKAGDRAGEDHHKIETVGSGQDGMSAGHDAEAEGSRNRPKTGGPLQGVNGDIINQGEWEQFTHMEMEGGWLHYRTYSEPGR